MGGGCSSNNAPDSDAGLSQSQVGGGGAPPPSLSPSPSSSPPPPPSPSPPPPPSPSPSPPPSPVSVLLPVSTTDEVPSDFRGRNGDSSADFTGEGFGDNKENIVALIDEFDQKNNVIMQKIKLLSQKYKYFRPVERDGNCFYRAFFFSYLEHVLEIEDESERRSEVTHLGQCIENAIQAYESLGSPPVLETKFLEAFYGFEHVFKLIEAGLSAEELYWKDMKNRIISKVLPSLRYMTAIELCTQEEFYSPFLSSVEEYESVHEFCQYEVCPMGTEANHGQITAIVNALGIPLILENLDTSLSYGVAEINQHTFCPRSNPEIGLVFANLDEEIEERTIANLSPAERRRLVTLLYRPGHYEILYPR